MEGIDGGAVSRWVRFKKFCHCSCLPDLRPLTIDHRPLTIDHWPSTIDHRLSTIAHRPSTIDHRPSTINHRSLTIDRVAGGWWVKVQSWCWKSGKRSGARESHHHHHRHQLHHQFHHQLYHQYDSHLYHHQYCDQSPSLLSSPSPPPFRLQIISPRYNIALVSNIAIVDIPRTCLCPKSMEWSTRPTMEAAVSRL